MSTSAPVQQLSSSSVAAIKAFRAEKPWRGTIEDRKNKLATLHAALVAAYGLPQELVTDFIDPIGAPGSSRFSVTPTQIALSGRHSVVTYLCAVGVARQFGYAQALNWAMGVYTRFFPLSAARHVARGGFLVRIEAGVAQ